MLDVFNEEGLPYEPYRRRKTGPEIPTHKGYPARQDPQAVNPTGVITSKTGETELRYWRNKHAAPSHNRGY